MIIEFLGDSITQGGCATEEKNRYVDVVAAILDATTINHGIGGTRIAKYHGELLYPHDHLPFYSRVDELEPNADLVCVMGGVNDYGHGNAPVGKLGDTEVDTFYGALDYLINLLLKKYSKDKILFIEPLYCIKEEDPRGYPWDPKTPRGPLEAYRVAIREVCAKYGIECTGEIKEKLGKPEEYANLYQDGLHPNDEGHIKLGHLVADYIKNRG